jgi:hypothetical protein
MGKKEKDYNNFNVAIELQGILAQNELKNWDLGKTYHFDILEFDLPCPSLFSSV